MMVMFEAISRPNGNVGNVRDHGSNHLKISFLKGRVQTIPSIPTIPSDDFIVDLNKLLNNNNNDK